MQCTAVCHFRKADCSSHATLPASFQQVTDKKRTLFSVYTLCNSQIDYSSFSIGCSVQRLIFYKLIKPFGTPCYLLVNYAEAFSPVPDYCSVRGNSCSILVYFAQWLLLAEDVLDLLCVN